MGTVLIADADVDFCIALMQALEADGHDTQIVQDGDEAWALLEKLRPTAMLLSEELPNMDAMPFLMRMRAEKLDTPTIILSRDGTATEAIRCMKAGAEDFLLRPRSIAPIMDLLGPLLETRAASAPDWMLEIPRDAIPGYRLLRTIGHGSYGSVHLGIPTAGADDAVPVAIKILLRDRIGASETADETISRFRREAEVASQIHHPAVAQVITYDMDDRIRYPYMVMEYIDGQLLSTLDLEDLHVGPACWIIQQLASGLAAIHAQGCVHRDVKPANIVLRDDQSVKILDFGSVVTPSSELTRTGNTLGTPLYMAPETFSSSRVDWRADIFSLGVVAYELLARRLPFAGRSVGTVAEAIRHHQPIPPVIFNSEIPADIDAMVMRMLSKSPLERFQSADEIGVICSTVTGRTFPA